MPSEVPHSSVWEQRQASDAGACELLRHCSKPAPRVKPATLQEDMKVMMLSTASWQWGCGGGSTEGELRCFLTPLSSA